MLRTYQTPAIEQVGGSDYELRTPVFFAALLAVVAAAIAVGLALVCDIYRAVTQYDVVYKYTEVEL
ncbi:MAG: hypothetical protein ACUVQ3_09415 [bacterium]